MSKFYKDKTLITSDGCKINYIDEGQNNSNTILFLHDFLRRGNSFVKVGENLLANNRIVWLDFRGHGKSKSNNLYNIETLAQDVNELINSIDLNNITIISYGLGSLVLFQYIKDFGLSKLKKAFLIDTSPKLLNTDYWHNGLYQGHYKIEEFNTDIKLIKNNPSKFLSFYYSQAMPEHTADESRNYEPTFLFKLLGHILLNKKSVKFWSSIVNSDFINLLPTISIPVAIIYGRPGSLYNQHTSLYMDSVIPDSKLYPLDDATHINISFKTTELLNIINNFNFNREFVK